MTFICRPGARPTEKKKNTTKDRKSGNGGRWNRVFQSVLLNKWWRSLIVEQELGHGGFYHSESSLAKVPSNILFGFLKIIECAWLDRVASCRACF